MQAPKDAAVIRAQGLIKEFGRTLAVDGLDLEVAPGEIFGLVGPDGAGKTTTIRLLAAVLAPTRGSVAVLGFDTLRQPEKAKEGLGYMPQHFSLYRELTVEENLQFFADLQGVGRSERKERIERLLAFTRLSPFRTRRAQHLSGGMQKKLVLASALIHRPRLLLLDEPTTGIDPVSRRELWQLFEDLHLEGITLFISTPYMDEAERSSRVGLMLKGRLVVCAEPRAIKARVAGDLVEVRPKVWYNPELASANFMIPGLLAAILQILTTMLTALGIVREREQGTIEQLIVTPIRPVELVVGKVAPYVVIAFVDLVEILALGYFLFHVPIRGSLPLLLALSALSLLTSLGMGLLISSISRSQQEAMLLTYFLLLPSIFLSGFMFPVAAMPVVLRYLSYAIPLTYLLIIVRSIILKGVGLEPLAAQVVILTVFGTAILLLAANRLQKRLE